MTVKRKKILLFAPAKINLFLHVLGRRADGYHDLETWMQKLDLHDSVTLETGEGDGIEFFCDDQELPGGAGNLAVKAANSFFDVWGGSQPLKLTIHLEKRIPIAAGLGGGSSDAGAVLRGLNQLFDFPLTTNQLVELARTLGADVPFFVIDSEAVVARGIGDVMSPVDSLDGCTFILVNPGFFVSTPWVFENLSLTSTDKKYNLSCFQKHKETSLSLQEIHNDLEEVTCASYPEIGDMKQMLVRLGASGVLMSGSGPTVFGVFPDSKGLSESDFDSIIGELSFNFGNKVFKARANAGAWPSG